MKLTALIIVALVIVLALIALAQPAMAAPQGRLITELGGGIKLLQGSSYLMMPDCKKATVSIGENVLRGPDGLYSCGGDNPLFVGWIMAWEFPSGVKLGYFHQSQWFDRDGEIKINCLCASGTIDWSKQFRRWRRR